MSSKSKRQGERESFVGVDLVGLDAFEKKNNFEKNHVGCLFVL